MKKFLCLLFGVLLLAGLATLGTAAEKGNWTGWIADSNCAKDYAKAGKAEHKDCALKCVERGAKWALATEKGHYLLEVDAAKAKEHVGHSVKVEGELNKETNTIKVSAINKPMP